MKARHGLVIGKFYPPHSGHHLLIRTAAATAERVTVVAMASSVESIPLEARVTWLREVHAREANVTVVGVVDDHPVDYGSDVVWRAHVELMLAGARQVTEMPVDAVFTSEAYGPELARRLGARHVSVDPDRALAPMSGTRVRADPVAAWDHLARPVRAGLALRVVIVGAESTGKTTLAEALADRLRSRGGAHGLTRWVAEYGREYTADLLAQARAEAQLAGLPPPALESLAWPSEAFVQIAAEQGRREDEAAGHGGPVLVCDTDAFATGVWHQRYLGHRSPPVEALARSNTLYLLTHHDDVSFDQDGLRDGERIRAWMTGVFVERLEATGRAWRWVRGSREERLRCAEACVDELLGAGWRFASPLG